MTARTDVRGIGLAASLALVAVGTPVPATACGGFFCSNTAPVNQAAERIIFSQNGDGTVTAVVQILYQGPSEEFAWVLPVPGRPDVGISSNTAFARLQGQTNPQYLLTTTIEGTCGGPTPFSAPPPPPAADAGAVDMGGGPPVSVIDSGTVGPFDYETISLDPALESPGDVAISWLEDHGYDVSAFGGERLGPYLADGMNLIAFRLTKGTMAGSIRPIVLTYETDHPMIPIRPTAVAANDDMGVLVWVLGDGRAVTTNYKTLVLNEALIDWLTGAANYDAVVTQAANEAQGQGFVTEQSGPTGALNRIFLAGEELPSRSDLVGRTEMAVLQDLTGRYRTHDGILDAAAAAIPVPADATVQDVLNCPECFLTSEGDDILGFTVEGLLAALEEWVVGPLRRTQSLIDGRPTITRLYTTMSAAEMTVDPEFELNPDLPEVSNLHRADRVIECSRRGSTGTAPWRVTLESGQVIRGVGGAWPFRLDDASPLPANARIEQASTAGPNEVVADNTGSISLALAEHNTTIRGPGSPAGGCTVGGRPSAVGMALGLVVALALIRRRRD